MERKYQSSFVDDFLNTPLEQQIDLLSKKKNQKKH